MQLTQNMAAHFLGGQMEIQNSNEGHLFRGEIAAIVVENNELKVKFNWLAKGEGGPPIPSKWVNDTKLDYAAGLEIYVVSNIGSSGGEVGGSDRLCLMSPIIGETVILYPPDGSKLDSSKVEGLVLDAKPAALMNPSFDGQQAPGNRLTAVFSHDGKDEKTAAGMKAVFAHYGKVEGKDYVVRTRVYYEFKDSMDPMECCTFADEVMHAEEFLRQVTI